MREILVWLSDLFDYGGALAKHWKAFLAGSIATAVLFVCFEAVAGFKLPPREFIAILVFLGLLAAGFAAWREQRERSRQAEAAASALREEAARIDFKVDSKAAALLDSLQKLRAWAEHAATTLQEPKNLVEDAASCALLRLPRLLKGIALLLENDLPHEADGLVRTLIEIAITSVWVSESEERAALFRNESARNLGVWLDSMAALGTKVPEENQSRLTEFLSYGAKQRMPSLEQRAEAIGSNIYSYSFRRVSAAAHGEHRLLHLSGLGHGEGDADLTLKDALLAAWTLLLGVEKGLRLVGLPDVLRDLGGVLGLLPAQEG